MIVCKTTSKLLRSTKEIKPGLMQVQRRQGVSVYCLSNGASIPEWLGDRARRNLNKIDDAVRHRVELLQDFEMPAASKKIIQSSDGRYIIAAGIYPPRIRCYDIHELSMKFERYVTGEIVDLCCLGTDYGKLALLQDDRTIAVHAHYGAHASVRIPHFGRAMVYEATTCEALIATSHNQIYRLNLEEGRFMAPWEMDVSTAAGVCLALHEQQPLAAVGCDDGILRFWDTRRDDPAAVLNLNVRNAIGNKGYGVESSSSFHDITSVNFDGGWSMGVGTARGVVALYDIRSSKPVFVQEHKSGTPIHTVLFHDSHILSSDSYIIKAWQHKADIGKVLVNIEGTGKLTSCMVASDDQGKAASGLLLCATDQPKMDAFYVPALGVAPAWCSFLDNITEELEETSNNGKEGTTTVFDNYKFVSREELERLGITNLIGTPMLKAYMHGFFIDTKLYQRVQAVKEPDSYEEYRKAKIKANMAAKSRISEQKALMPSKVSDARFGKMLTNPDFAVDEETEDFKLRHPNGLSKRKRAENFDSDEEKDEPNVPTDSIFEESNQQEELSDDDSSDEDSVGLRKVREEDNDDDETVEKPDLLPTKSKRQTSNAKQNVISGEEKMALKKASSNVIRRRKLLILEEADDDVGQKDRIESRRTLAERVSQIQQEELSNPVVRINESGKKEVTFIPKTNKNSSRDRDQRDEGNDARERPERRGIKELGFKQPSWNRGGRGRGRGNGRGGRGRGRGRSGGERGRGRSPSR